MIELINLASDIVACKTLHITLAALDACLATVGAMQRTADGIAHT